MVWNYCLLLLLLHTSRIWARAQFEEQKRIIQQTIDTLARLNSTGNNPQDVNQLAISTLTNPLIAELINQHGLADIQISDGATLLLAGAKGGSLPIVRTILDQGAFINLRDENGNSALIWAASKNNAEVAVFLIGRSADVNIANTDYGDTALSWAAYHGNRVLSEALVNAGAKVNHANFDRKTPLMIAATRGHLEVMNYLIGKGADVNHLDENGWTSLVHASQNNHLEVVRSLLKGGANPDLKTNNFGDTALLWAITKGNNLVVRELLVGGADFSLPNNFGQTPLMTAAVNNKPEEARLLLSAGADIDRQDELGDTSLMDAANKGFTDVVRVFLEHCPNLQLVNQNRKTVQFIAFNRQIPEISKMIEDHPNRQCSHDNRIYGVGQTRYDVCREVKCCQGVWSPTGQTLETCGKQCRKILAPAGVCTLIASCPILQQEFLSTVQASTDRSNSGREFVKNYGCGFAGGSDLRVCCPTA